MQLSQGTIQSLQALVEQQREIEQLLEQSDVFRAVRQFSEQKRQMASVLHGIHTAHIQETAKLVNSFPIEEYQRTAALLQGSVVRPEVFRGIQKAATAQQTIAMQLAANQALPNAVAQFQDLAQAVSELRKVALYAQHFDLNESSVSSPEAQSLPEHQPPSATDSIVSYTLDPYGPVREEIYATQRLLAAYILAATVDSGELADDLSESQKKGIRLGLAILVGFAAGLPAGFVMGPIGLTVGIGASSLASSELKDIYDIKRQQSLPQDEYH